MKKIVAVFVALTVMGCARVNLQTSKPIKVDMNIRVDVYQHVVKDASSIEDQVYGDSQKKLNALFGMENAYAEDQPQQLNSVIERRKGRVAKIEEYFRKGYIGENRNALLEIVDPNLDPGIKGEVEGLIQAENQDREMIYKANAQKNNADISQVHQAFFEDHYKRAPGGYYFEIYDQAQGKYAWVKK
ncbi:MAG: DUF1318 domain-containing protein [Deltaproteobacteria bacterium]